MVTPTLGSHTKRATCFPERRRLEFEELLEVLEELLDAGAGAAVVLFAGAGEGLEEVLDAGAGAGLEELLVGVVVLLVAGAGAGAGAAVVTVVVVVFVAMPIAPDDVSGAATSAPVSKVKYNM